jgi:dTDP-glucose 4,6-dehydratase
MSKHVLVTGSAGFVPANLVEHLLKNTDWTIVGLDRLDTFSNLRRVGDVLDFHPEFRKRFKFVWWDLKAPITQNIAAELGKVNYIFHLAASSHVDDSITNPLGYCYDNVVGSVNIFDYARQLDSLEYIQSFGTDEVYGNAAIGQSYKEEDRYLPRNPYAAFKAGCDHVAYAYHATYGLPIVITNCTNIIGAKQDRRKYLPLVINKLLDDEELLIHCYPGCKQAGSRQYVHARNVAAACLFLVDKAIKGDKYNLPGQCELDNLEFAQIIAKYVGKPLKYKMVDFHSNRPGHDHRYSLDGTKLRSMGFEYPVEFEVGLEKTVKWYLDNREWLL